MTNRLTLHEAMITVLRSHGGGWMDRDAIAREIAARDLFRRPSDGAHPPSDQLRLQARKPEYQHLFECSDTPCSKMRLRAAGALPTASGGATRERSAARVGGSTRPTVPSTTAGEDDGEVWYERLRQEYRPSELRILLIGESPPDPGDGERRFFYSPTLARYDNLYRGVAEAVYGDQSGFVLEEKEGTLRRLQVDGFWLIDAVRRPINKASRSARKRAIQEAVPELSERCAALAPEVGVIICHTVVYEATAYPLRSAGIEVLHGAPIPFPLGNWRAEFVRRFREALA
jgi:hypothetical protein